MPITYLKQSAIFKRRSAGGVELKAYPDWLYLMLSKPSFGQKILAALKMYPEQDCEHVQARLNLDYNRLELIYFSAKAEYQSGDMLLGIELMKLVRISRKRLLAILKETADNAEKIINENITRATEQLYRG